MNLFIAQEPAAPTAQTYTSGPTDVEAIIAANKPLSGRRILVVEDEMLVLMDAEDMLVELGCSSVVGAATVDQALAFIRTEPPDAVLLDLNLNGDRSYAVADALAACGIPFAFATGYGTSGLREEDSNRPMLSKPYRCDELAKTIGALFRR